MTKNPYSLKKGKVLDIWLENYNTVSLLVESDIVPESGQYVMFYAFGRGEAPITVAGYKDGISLHSVRVVGDVTGFFKDLKKGENIYLRGPYGNKWDLNESYGKHILIVSGGLGFAATRWLTEEVIDSMGKFRSAKILYGSKSYEDLLYRDIIREWKSKIDFQTIIQNPDKNWDGKIGLITDLIHHTEIEKETSVFLCGPDPMVKAVVDLLTKKGLVKDNIKVSLERHMKCSVGTCGHCMFGPYFVCKDGPIFKYSDIEYFYNKKGV